MLNGNYEPKLESNDLVYPQQGNDRQELLLLQLVNMPGRDEKASMNENTKNNLQNLLFNALLSIKNPFPLTKL